MVNILSQLEALNEKTEKLIHLHRLQKEQNRELLINNQNLQSKINSQQKEIDQLNENYRILKITKSLASTQEGKPSDVRSKINELVREIDKCIALLNK